MNVMDAIETRLEIREFADEPVEDTTKQTILDAARLAPSGRNFQHWRFILVDDRDDLGTLAEKSMTGGWVDGADFAVVVLTDPEYAVHGLDAGRAISNMQYAGWEHGVGSCIFTGYDESTMREFLDIPAEFAIPVIVGFGHPTFAIEGLEGKKDREPLSAVVHHGRFGESWDQVTQ